MLFRNPKISKRGMIYGFKKVSIFEITSPEGECNYCPNCGAKMEVDE